METKSINEADIERVVEAKKNISSYDEAEKFYNQLGDTFKNLHDKSLVMEPETEGKEALKKSLPYLLEGNSDQAYQEIKDEVDPDVAMTFLMSTYEVVERLGYDQEDIASESGIKSEVRVQEPVKPKETDKTKPLKELPEVFDRSYSTLMGWLSKKDLSEYSLKDGKTHTFSKESLEAFVAQELEPSDYYSTYEIQDIYNRIAGSFGGEAKEVKDDLFKKNKRLPSTKKLEIMEEQLGRSELHALIKETCTDQQSKYIMDYLQGTPHDEIAEGEDLSRGAVTHHIDNGTRQAWKSMEEELG